jgi:large subunit ribosomal protein L3
MAFRMGLIGKKLGMTQVFTPEGERVPVTAIATGPCVIVAKRTPERNKYSAIEIGFGEQKASRLNRPQTGQLAKAGIKSTPAILREIRLTEADLGKYEVGQILRAADVFEKGHCVDVIGQSKGKGFQGVLKRHHLGGSRATHGSHEFFRHGGSIGCRLTPGRVHKGKRMSGHLGDERVTVQNLEIVEVLPEENLVLVRGSVPGCRNGYVILQRAVKRDQYKKVVKEIAHETKSVKAKAVKK